MASYPFDPRPSISGTMVLLFGVLTTAIVFVYAQVHRDPILSLVTNTKPGELGGDFWLKLLGFGTGPVLGLLTALFPQVTDFLFSWVQPNLSSIK
jgi:CDP-diglyceride synthetase